ncbi:MAG: transposase, partial [Candidatus Parvarchaeum sp.]|nr:transposase [Candidatus Parvarchaeum tengchongense]
HFYGKEDESEVNRKTKNDLGIRIINRYEDRGTRKYLGFITMSILEKNYRFIIYAIPVFDKINKVEESDLLQELVEKARKYIDIRYLYADRGFASASNFSMLDKLGVTYIIPLPDNSGIKRVLNYGQFPLVINDFERGGYTIKSLCLIKASRGTMKVATNMLIKNEDLDMLSRLPFLYSKRWGIETSYRVIKRGGLVVTTSRNYNFRLFFFMLSVFIYNIWVSLNILFIIILGYSKDGHYSVIFKSLIKRFVHLIDIT